VDQKKRGQTLVELGDWYMSAGALTKGLDTYREAWKALSEANAVELLQMPRLLAYRPPPTSARRSRLGPDESEERYVELRYTVTRDGRTSDVQTVSADASESAQKAVVSAMKKARYAPRFVNGEPVDTPNVTWREIILVKVKQQTASN
jgi:TonB family protein